MIYMFCAPGFEETEAIVPLDILRRAELNVETVGVGGKTVVSSHGVKIECDIAEEDVIAADMEMIILPGGMPGTLNLEKSAVVQASIDHAARNNLWIAAICAAPSILGHKGLLDGIRSTCFPGYETQLGKANYTGAACEMDGMFITARGAGVALQFGFKIVEALLGTEQSNKIIEAMQCEKTI